MSKEDGVLSGLIEELRESPEGAIELLSAMTNIVRPWESLKTEGQSVMHTYRRVSAMGEEVARIESNAPTWILTIQGERYTGSKVFNTKDADKKAKALLDAGLKEEGFVLMEPQV